MKEAAKVALLLQMVPQKTLVKLKARIQGIT